MGKSNRKLEGTGQINRDNKNLKETKKQVGDMKVLGMQSREKGLCQLSENLILGL